MASALVDALSPTSESRAGQERQFSRHEDALQRDGPPPAEPILAATQEMCAYCFDVIIAHFNDLEPPPPSFPTSYVCGMFVTWDKHEHGMESLRGCIGTLTPMSISSLRDYTYSSALNDRRFSPIEPSELHSLDLSVSLLVKYEQARHVEDWEVQYTARFPSADAAPLSRDVVLTQGCGGTRPSVTTVFTGPGACKLVGVIGDGINGVGVHGIVINFSDDRGSAYSATFLPEVASEQGWSRKVTLTRLVRKAGYKRTVDADFLSRVQVTRYQSSKHKLPYRDYLEMRRLV